MAQEAASIMPTRGSQEARNTSENDVEAINETVGNIESSTNVKGDKERRKRC